MSDDGPPESLPPIAAKADDLEAVRAAMVDAAAVSSTLWISYLFALFYLLVAAGAVTHRDLFFENPVKLPFLGVDLPLKAFFWLGPALFVIVHAYVLLHFVLLAGKIGVFDAQLRAQVADLKLRTRLRRQLPSNIFVQFLAGPVEIRQGLVGLLLEVIAWISLVIGPVLLLVFFQLQFLPYHEEWITWWQRIAVLIDVSMLWALWPAVVRETDPDKSAATWSAWRRRRSASLGRGMEWLFGPLFSANRGSPAVGRFDLRWSTVSTLGCVTVVSLPLVFAIATFPGEWLYVQGYIPLRKALVEGDVDFGSRRPRSLWSNRLVLPGLDVIDHSRFDSEEKIAALPTTVSLRKRDLRGAVLIDAELRKADLTAANLLGAKLAGADLRGATLECGDPAHFSDCAQLQGASLDLAQLQGASLQRAQLRGASLDLAQLQGALLDGAQLQGASLQHAQLQGASLRKAQLQGASLSFAQLQGASLSFAQLQGALLDGAQLQGALLDGAQLQGASLIFAQLQGASLYGAQLQGASLYGAQLQSTLLYGAQLEGASLDHADLQGARLAYVSVWRTSSEGVTFGNAFVSFLVRPSREACQEPAYQGCGWSPTALKQLDDLIVRTVPEGGQRDVARQRIESRLNPDIRVDRDQAWAGIWARAATSQPPLSIYEVGLAEQWFDIGCQPDGAPYALHGLLGTMSRRFSRSISQIPRLAAHFLSDTCAGARGLSAADRSLLERLRDRAAAPAAAQAKP